MDNEASKDSSKNAVPSLKRLSDDDADITDKIGESVAEGECKTIDDDDRTLECEEESVQQTASYSNADFRSDCDHSDDDVQTQEDHGKQQKTYETRSSNKKYHQTTLKFEKHDADSDDEHKKRRRTADNLRRWKDEDTENYRKGYPGQKDNLSLNDNLRFYKGEIRSQPDGDYIDTIHNEWFGKYELLERHHGYIQWLFPIREHGTNFYAQPLQPHEAKAFQEDPKVNERILKSFELMLDFYGMELEATGKISRSMKWKERYDNLSRNAHNNLRITRILKFLGEVGLEHLKKPFVSLILEEVFIKGKLKRTLDSCINYWIGTVKNDKDRTELYDIIEDNTSC